MECRSITVRDGKSHATPFHAEIQDSEFSLQSLMGTTPCGVVQDLGHCRYTVSGLLEFTSINEVSSYDVSSGRGLRIGYRCFEQAFENYPGRKTR